MYGHVAEDEGSGLGAGYGGDVVTHVSHGDVCGIGVAEDDHAEGIADEQDIDAAFVKQPRAGVIVGGEGGDFGFAFAGGDGVGFLRGTHLWGNLVGGG